MDAERAARIATLIDHPGFVELQHEITEIREKYAAALAKTMLATGEPFADFEYKRGYFAGATAITSKPETALARIRRDIEKAQQEEQSAGNTDG